MTEHEQTPTRRTRRRRTGSGSPAPERTDDSIRDTDRGEEFGALFEQGSRPHMFADVPRREVR